MKIVNVPIEQIIPYAANPRNIAPAIEAVAASIREFGFRVPLVLDEYNVVVTGHTRLAAAKQLGIKELPCVIASDLTDEQIKRFRLVDNKVSEFSIWDEEKLIEELEAIDNIDMAEFGFDALEEKLDSEFTFTSEEISLDEFDEEHFDYECKECGFKFNA